MVTDPHLIIAHPQWAGRTCTLICGPPGSGKTTLANTLHPNRLDLDDLPPGTPRERMRTYGRIAYRAGRNPSPNLAVIRGAPTEAERQHQANLAHPSRTIILLTPAHICHQRIDQRARPGINGRDITDQHTAVDKWWKTWNAEHVETTRQTSRTW